MQGTVYETKYSRMAQVKFVEDLDFRKFEVIWIQFFQRLSSKIWLGSFFKSSHPKLFLRKGVLKICSKFKGEHSCRSVISIKLQSNVAYLLHIFRTPFSRNTSGLLLLILEYVVPYVDGWCASFKILHFFFKTQMTLLYSKWFVL